MTSDQRNIQANITNDVNECAKIFGSFRNKSCFDITSYVRVFLKSPIYFESYISLWNGNAISQTLLCVIFALQLSP